MKKFACIVLFVCLLAESFQRSTRESDSYVAAVLEYNFVGNTSVNLQNYLTYIEEAAAQNADIVVFPEMTLTRGDSIEVPIHGSLKENPVPAAAPYLYNPILVSLSVAAAASQVYVVVNVQEVMDCTSGAEGEECPESKEYLFNTNIVLDRNGAVIDRFRKINLFGEFTRTPALHPELGIFDTDFGVTFGHYICFDLMFQVPAIQVVEKHNITDVVFTTMWFSEMPFLTAVQIQEAYAYAMNVNFLASGANNVRVGSAGSGIYSGKAGALISTMPGISISRLLVSRVPKVPGQVTFEFPGPIYDPPNEADGLLMKQDLSLTAHVSRALVPGFQEFTLSQNEVSCRFRIRMTQRSGDVHYQYRAAAFDGIRTFDGYASAGTRTCTVMSCAGPELDTCGVRFPTYAANTTAIFEELFIEATVPSPVLNQTLETSDCFYSAITLDVATMPLGPLDYTFNETVQGGNTTYTMILVKTDAELYTFSVWGRWFDGDGEEPTAPGSSAVHFVNCLLLAPVLWLFVRE